MATPEIEQWLTAQGYITKTIIDGEPQMLLSKKALALVSGVPESSINCEDGQISDALMRDMRRGANALMAKYDSMDMLEILFFEAAANLMTCK